MATDVSTLVNMVAQTSRGTQPSSKTTGSFHMGRLPAGNQNPGSFNAPWQDPTHQARMRSLARMDPRVSFINARGQRESGWRYRQPPLVRITDRDRILNMVMDANNYEQIKPTAPPGTYEYSAQRSEQLSNPIGLRERRRTARQILTGR